MKLECTVTITVGIHIDDADVQELEILCDNFNKCFDSLMENVKHQRSDIK